MAPNSNSLDIQKTTNANLSSRFLLTVFADCAHELEEPRMQHLYELICLHWIAVYSVKCNLSPCNCFPHPRIVFGEERSYAC